MKPKQRMPYGTARWQKKRARQLAKEPLCQFCLNAGKVKAANVADHIIPHRGDIQAFWSNKLQSLCKHCHDSMKQREEKSAGKPIIGTDGWPVETTQ